MDSNAVWGLLGALIGGVATTSAAWLTQRAQFRRDAIERARVEAVRWTEERRRVFAEVNATADEWAYLLRTIAAELRAGGGSAVDDDQLHRVERRFHGLVYEAALLCSPSVSAAVDGVEDRFRMLTTELGRDTQYTTGAAQPVPRQAAAAWAGGDRPELRRVRVALMHEMRRELGLPKIDIDVVVPPSSYRFGTAE